VSRYRTYARNALIALGTAALFALFIVFRSDATLIAALSAAGTVAAAGFAAVAAVGAMRAAAESGEAARRAREAVARTAQPRVHPSIERVDGKVLGKVQSGAGRDAIDVTVVWMQGGENISKQTARLSDVPFAVDLALPETADPWEAISMLWVEYWDDSRVGHWQDTWQVDATPGQARFVLTDSRLVG
jgi:hypothetical protein